MIRKAKVLGVLFFVMALVGNLAAVFAAEAPASNDKLVLVARSRWSKSARQQDG